MSTLHPEAKLDHYKIENLAARSGMASIYRATDLRDGKQVAIKIPHPEVEADVLMFDRFKREEEIGIKLDHPAVMRVFGSEDRTQLYMVMEWVDGVLLRQVMNREKKVPIDKAVKITEGIAEALDYIHSQGVVHRDLKPENVMIQPDGSIKLIDFGIAGSNTMRRLTFANLTKSMGTPDYISPEQVRSKRGDARSDIYSLGVMLYEMLTGQVPWQGPNPFAIMNDRLLNNPPPPRELNPAITPQLQEIVYRALERNPANRYQSVRELLHDLQHQDQVGVADRPELRDWRKRKSPIWRTVLFYIALALIPVVVLGVLFWVARHT